MRGGGGGGGTKGRRGGVAITMEAKRINVRNFTPLLSTKQKRGEGNRKEGAR